MRIKRTFAPTMREALLLVKQEQGMDAVILGNKKVPGGVEIMSAIDFDEVAMTRMVAEAEPPRRPPEVESNNVSSDVVSDSWAGALLNDGRREPTLGPVARKKPAAVLEMNTAAPVMAAAVVPAELK